MAHPPATKKITFSRFWEWTSHDMAWTRSCPGALVQSVSERKTEKDSFIWSSVVGTVGCARAMNFAGSEWKMLANTPPTPFFTSTPTLLHTRNMFFFSFKLIYRQFDDKKNTPPIVRHFCTRLRITHSITRFISILTSPLPLHFIFDALSLLSSFFPSLSLSFFSTYSLSLSLSYFSLIL